MRDDVRDLNEAIRAEDGLVTVAHAAVGCDSCAAGGARCPGLGNAVTRPPTGCGEDV